MASLCFLLEKKKAGSLVTLKGRSFNP